MKKNRKSAASKTANAVIPPEGLIRAWIRFGRGPWIPVGSDGQTWEQAQAAIKAAIAEFKPLNPKAATYSSRIRIDYPKRMRPVNEPRCTIKVKLRPAKRRHQN